MVTINDAEENKFATDYLAQENNVSAWIGLKYDKKLGNWKWQDGSQDSFRAWDASYGQPDLKHSPPEYYTSLITGLESHPQYSGFSERRYLA